MTYLKPKPEKELKQLFEHASDKQLFELWYHTKDWDIEKRVIIDLIKRKNDNADLYVGKIINSFWYKMKTNDQQKAQQKAEIAELLCSWRKKRYYGE